MPDNTNGQGDDSQGPPPLAWGDEAAASQAQGYAPWRQSQSQSQGYGQAQGYPPAPGPGYQPASAYPPAGQYGGWGEPPPPGKTLSVLAIVLGALALVFFPLGLAAVVLAIIAAAKGQRYGTLALVIAVAGLILGIAIIVALVA